MSIGFKRVAEEIKLSYRYAIWCMRIKEKKIPPLQVTYEILIITHFHLMREIAKSDRTVQEEKFIHHG